MSGVTWSCGCKTRHEAGVYYIQPCEREGCEIEPIIRSEAQRRNQRLVVGPLAAPAASRKPEDFGP